MAGRLRVLIIEDSEDDKELLLRELKRGDYDVEHGWVERAKDLETALETQAWDVVVSDYSMSAWTALDALKIVRDKRPDLPFIVISERITEDAAAAVMKAGAQDYFSKSHLERLASAVKRQLREAHGRRGRKHAEELLKLQSAVARLGQKALLETDIDALMDAAVALVTQTLSIDQCGVLELVPGKNELLPRTSTAGRKDAAGPGNVGVTARSQIGYMLRVNEPLIVEDFLTETRFAIPEPQRHSEVRSAVSVIIGGRDRPYGVLGAHSRERGRFAPDDASFLQSIANVLAAAIQRVRDQKELSYQALLLANLNDAVIATDENLVVTSWNPTAEDLYGWTAEEALGSPLSEVLPTEFDGMTVDEAIHTLKETGQFRGEIVQRRKNGRPIHIETTSIALRDEAGVTTGYVSVNRDVTDRRNAQETLRLEAQLLDAATDAIFLHDLDGKIFYVNQAASKLYGYTHDELMRMNARDVVGPNAGKPFLPHLRGLQRTGEVSFESAHQRKDGSTMVVEAHARTVRTARKVLVLNSIRDITSRVEAGRALSDSVEELERMLHDTVSALALTAEQRDPYTAGHQRRVAELACAIAAEMGLPESEIEGISVAATLHDIGKIYVPAEILSKPGRLTDIEMELVRAHPQTASEILGGIRFPWPVTEMVMQHHERLDGSGYPRGLKESDILREAKILAVADVVEAMSSHRPYRPSLGVKPALEEILRHKSDYFDPEVVDACVQLFTKKGFRFSREMKAAS